MVYSAAQLAEKLGPKPALSTEAFHNSPFTYISYRLQVLI